MPIGIGMGNTTAVYIDGYNLYYGRIRGTSYKWTDLVALSDRLLHEQDPAGHVQIVRYFSAFCLAKFASHGAHSAIAQDRYLRAHEALHAERFMKTMGVHTHDRAGMSMPRYIEGSPYDRRDRVKVWKLEEKQTDVNIALAMYRDAASQRFSQQVVFSNDSDVEPVLQVIREDFPHIQLGVITPRRPPESGVPQHRNMLSSLTRIAHWSRSHIPDEALDACPLPQRVRTRKRPIDKPDHW
jgi:hypothetical protein